MSQALNNKENANQEQGRRLLFDDDRRHCGGVTSSSTTTTTTASSSSWVPTAVPSATMGEGKGSSRQSSTESKIPAAAAVAPRTSSFARSSPAGLRAVSSSSTSSSSRLVLRPGEALEELFGIVRPRVGGASSVLAATTTTKEIDDEYRALCESIVRGGAAADDATAWKNVLDRASRAVNNNKSNKAGSGGPSSGISPRPGDRLVLRPDFSLLRLHRRATSRVLKPPDSPHILDVWLSYASCQLASDLRDDALLSLSFVQQRLESPNGGGPYVASYFLRLANLLVTAGSTDGAVHVLEVGLERHRGDEHGGMRRPPPPPELVERLAQLRGVSRDERARGKAPRDGAPNHGKRRTPLSTLSSSSSSPLGESKRLKLDAASALEMPSESSSVTVGDTSFDAQTIKRLPLASIPLSKPPSVLASTRSTSDDTERGAAPTESKLAHHQQFQQQRPSLRVPSAHSNVPLLPKLSAYSSVSAGLKSASPGDLTRANETKVGRIPLAKPSSWVHPSRSDARADEHRATFERLTPVSATVTADGQGSLLNQSSESVAASDLPESDHVSGADGKVGRFMQRKSDCGGTETTPSRPPLGLRCAVASSAVPQPTSASRLPTLTDRMSRGVPRGSLNPTDHRVDATSPSPNENEQPRKSTEGGKHDEDSTTRSSNGDDSKASPRKVNMDISYMWEWDPHKVVRSTAEPSVDSPNASTKLSQSAAKLETIKEDETADPPLTSKAELKLEGLKQQDPSNDVSFASSSEGANNNASVPSSAEKEPAATTPSTLSDSETASLLQNCNRDFLPLVDEANILRVNNIPYLKLGVLGKGGSCKVYRALTKNCSVVAIKKVKLNGMDRSAVKGYANEIALLKRLKGNSSIIQMIDSQIDLKSKRLFVVMEQGETDLNHVLQQQALSSAADARAGRRHLNMNFVRLTWHQMLSAVHCIHEARIIHSDLKPANFLFVKGALKLIDFGIAKAIQSEDTTNLYRDNQIGTVNYMSPEAIAADTGATQRGDKARIFKVGRASDIWSLGCILYQMVYGQTPFADLHMIQKLRAITDPHHAISFPDGADKDAIDAMKQCLRRKPDERAPIVGPGGLLSEHRFLHPKSSSPPPA